MQDKSQSLVFLFAAERSGTHLLRSLLQNHDRIVAPGELCNAVANSKTTNDLSYLKYRHSAITKEPHLVELTDQNQRHILSGYFEMIRKHFVNKDIIVCDIKYAHVHNFNSAWWDFTIRPSLLSFAQDNGIRIIHLVRNKLYQTVFSTMYAETTGVWRATREDELSQASISVDLQELERRAKRTKRTIKLFDGWLSGCKTLPIFYEDLTGPDRELCLARLEKFLDVEGKIEFRPGFLKTTPPYDQSVQNLAEVLPLLERTIDEM